MQNKTVTEVLEKLHKNGLSTYSVLTGIEEEYDIVLSDSRLDEFVRFCDEIGNKVVFYQVDYVELEDYLVDEEIFRVSLESLIEEKIKETYFLEDDSLSLLDFQEEIRQALKRVRQRNTVARREYSKIKEGEYLQLSIFTLFNGVQVGIVLNNSCMEHEALEGDVEDLLEEIFEATILPIIEEKRLGEEERWERFKQQMEEERKQEREKKQAVLKEIEEMIHEDESIADYTNGKQRHAYAKRVSEQYTERYGMPIRIGEVEDIVTQRYRQIKKGT